MELKEISTVELCNRIVFFSLGRVINHRAVRFSVIRQRDNLIYFVFIVFRNIKLTPPYSKALPNCRLLSCFFFFLGIILRFLTRLFHRIRIKERTSFQRRRQRQEKVPPCSFNALEWS